MKTFSILNSMKFGYFMLVVCVTLLLGANACSSEEFGMDVPEVSRTIETRAAEPLPVSMTAHKKEVRIRCLATEDITVYWDEEDSTKIYSRDNNVHRYTFAVEKEKYNIEIKAHKNSILELDVSGNELDYLNVENNTNLEVLECNNNKLKSLSLTGCLNLREISATWNELSTIDLTDLYYLNKINLSINKFTQGIDFSKNLNLHSLWLEHCEMSELDVSKNKYLQYLNIGGNYIQNLDLTNNTDLREITLYDLPLYTINNKDINRTSFSSFKQLETLNIQNIPFDALDLSQNKQIRILVIYGTEIDTLDLREVFIDELYADGSKLRTIMCAEKSLMYCYLLTLYNTPFETQDENYLRDFVTNYLYDRRNNPIRDGSVVTGYIFTNSPTIIGYAKRLQLMNWVVL